MKNDQSRKCFLQFCNTVRNVERDKDTFLKAANLERHERQAPAFTANQMMMIVLVIGVLLLGSVAMICLTLAGKTGSIGFVLVSTLFAIVLLSALSIMNF